MSIIVGSKTKLECDGVGCNKSSQSDHDQLVAVNSDYSIGWVKNPTNGKTFCPSCMKAHT